MAQRTAAQSALHEKSVVAASSVAAAVLLTSMKVVVGVATGSLGILSEAAHSGLDLVAAAMTYFAVRVSAQPADHEHTYGHGKFENLSALFETLLLLVTCVWIIYEAVSRLFFREVPIEVTPWSFAVMGTSIIVDISRSRALSRAAKKYNSQALEADALHFSTDVWSSTVVILGLIGVVMAPRLGLPWLAEADAVAALCVAAIVVWVSVQLGKKSIADLVDAVPDGVQQSVARAAEVAGVLEVMRVRIRKSGADTFADVTLAVRRDTALEQAHEIASRAESAIREAVPGADVVVHVEPVRSANETTLSTLRLLAARQNLGAHAIRIYEHQGQRSVELHLEVDPTLDVRTAHEHVTAFERAAHEALPALEQIVTHIEPATQTPTIGGPSAEDVDRVREALSAAFAEIDPRVGPHDLRVTDAANELHVSFHCAMCPQTSITEAHELTERLEQGLRARLARIGRVVIHVEPQADDN